jgi:hypothetical protein
VVENIENGASRGEVGWLGAKAGDRQSLGQLGERHRQALKARGAPEGRIIKQYALEFP